MISGELHGLTEIRNTLHNNRHFIHNRNDVSELISHFYEDQGEKLLGYLNGCFNLLIVDVRKEKVVVANDRFGLSRFYYCKLPEGGMMFAPELKCFRLLPDLKVNLDLKAVIQNFKYDCILDNNSFFEEVKRFPIATSFIFQNDKCKDDVYWSPEEILDKPKLTVDSFINKSTQLFESITENYYTLGQTGLSLTGGWDTRAILSVLYRKEINVPCYTFGGVYKDSFDVRIAEKLSNRTGNSFKKILLGKEFLGDIENWVNRAIYISDGIAKLTTCHEYYVNLAAREFGKIRLTGKYGSQIVRGVTLLKDRSPDLGIFSRDFRQRYINQSYEFKKSGVATLLREELPQLEGNKQTQEMAALTLRTPYMDNSFVDLMLRAPRIKDTSLLQKNIILRNAPHFADISTNRGELIKKGIFQNINKMYYTSMNFIDTVYNWERLPIWALWVCLVGDVLGISRFFNGNKEWIHYRLWFKNELKEYISQVILDPVTLQRPWYDSSFLRKIMNAHCSGVRNYTSEIDKIVSFEIWCRMNDI
jgi:asparagine synthase (glutamine-hydrolysing)